jgi:dUTP pyrophosphatase
MSISIFEPMKNEVKVPCYETSGSAGMDVRAYMPFKDIYIRPGEWRAIPTGLKVNLMEGFELQVRPRSGLAAKHGVTVLNSPGTVDSDYKGEVQVILINHGTQPFWIKSGDRIAQLVYSKVTQAPGVRVSSRVRGEGGFNSTGVK